MPNEPQPYVGESDVDDSYASSLDDLFRGWDDGEYVENSPVSEGE